MYNVESIHNLLSRYNKLMPELKYVVTFNDYRIQTCSTPMIAIDNIFTEYFSESCMVTELGDALLK